MPHPWQPLLQGEERQKAQEAIHNIAEALAPLSLSDPSFCAGQAGIALFYGFLARAEPDPKWEALAEENLAGAIQRLAEDASTPSLYDGFPGVAFALEILEENTAEGEDDPNKDVDEVLLEYLNQSSWEEDYELIYGLAGLGIYALERLPRPGARACLLRILEHLEQLCERHPEGVTWRKHPNFVPPDMAARYPKGSFNLGLAHGVTGPIGVLGRMLRALPEEARTRPLLSGAVLWLLHQRHPETSWLLPTLVAEDTSPVPSRSAWCYGAPGAAAALFVAARGADEPGWEKEALDMARHAARRPPEESGVVDAGLCHGAAGLGHIFNRLYQATGDETLREAARFWLAHTLSLQKPGEGCGGFLAWETTEEGEPGWLATPGLLTGAAGVGLALLAATSPIEPAWDRALLLSG